MPSLPSDAKPKSDATEGCYLRLADELSNAWTGRAVLKPNVVSFRVLAAFLPVGVSDAGATRLTLIRLRNCSCMP